MSRDFFLKQSSHGEAVQRPTLADLAAGPSYSCAALFQRLTKHSHLASRTSRGPGREGEPCPSVPVLPPAKRWHSPRCPAGCTWLPRLPQERVRDDQLVLRRLGPDPPDVPALGRERKREENRGSPAPAARRESGRGTLWLPLASFLLRRIFNWGAATAGPRPSPRPHAGREPRGRARGWCPSPRRPGAGLRPAPPSHPPTHPAAPQSRGFGGSQWRSHPAGTEREAGDELGRTAPPRAPRPLGVSFVRRRSAAAL